MNEVAVDWSGVQWGQLELHWYGLLIGIALVCGWYLAKGRFERWLLTARLNTYQRYRLSQWWSRTGITVVTASLIGARAWHVLTDWSLYRSDLISIVFVWRGGMSIIGAILFGLGTLGWLLWHSRLSPEQKSARWPLLDSLVFGLPVAQAIGRMGNYLNTELYGLPTNLPWGLAINSTHRPVGYQQYTYFHPLFAYEAIALLLFAAGVWVIDRRRPQLFGTGQFLWFYLMYYSLIRFLLDFLRLDRGPSWLGLGLNQWVMFTLFISCGLYWYYHFFRNNRKSSRSKIDSAT